MLALGSRPEGAAAVGLHCLLLGPPLPCAGLSGVPTGEEEGGLRKAVVAGESLALPLPAV